MKVVPSSTTESTVTSPLADATNPLTIASPSPDPTPSAFVVKNGSKMRWRSSTGIPVPLSRTAISTRLTPRAPAS